MRRCKAKRLRLLSDNVSWRYQIAPEARVFHYPRVWRGCHSCLTPLLWRGYMSVCPSVSPSVTTFFSSANFTTTKKITHPKPRGDHQYCQLPPQLHPTTPPLRPLPSIRYLVASLFQLELTELPFWYLVEFFLLMQTKGVKWNLMGCIDLEQGPYGLYRLDACYWVVAWQ